MAIAARRVRWTGVCLEADEGDRAPGLAQRRFGAVGGQSQMRAQPTGGARVAPPVVRHDVGAFVRSEETGGDGVVAVAELHDRLRPGMQVAIPVGARTEAGGDRPAAVRRLVRHDFENRSAVASTDPAHMVQQQKPSAEQWPQSGPEQEDGRASGQPAGTRGLAGSASSGVMLAFQRVGGVHSPPQRDGRPEYDHFGRQNFAQSK